MYRKIMSSGNKPSWYDQSNSKEFRQLFPYNNNNNPNNANPNN